MGLWADTIGGGNTFSQSVSNTFGGTNYVNGAEDDGWGGGWSNSGGSVEVDDPYNNHSTDPAPANTGGGGGGSSAPAAPAAPATPDLEALTAEDILKMAEDAGIVSSNEDIQAMIDDPAAYLDGKGMTLSDLITLNDPNAAGTNLDPNNPNYELGDAPYYDPETVDTTETVKDEGKGTVSLYNASTVTNLMGGESTTVDAVTGEVTDNMLVDPDDVKIDIDGIGAGEGVLGEALNDFASQDISNIIDTSTVAGKLLAQKLGEGNYTDAKATVLGQMKIISAEFKDSNGNPRIPEWAQGLSREAGRAMAFKGITGSAGVELMSNALMQATLGVAEKDAAFFQTVSLKNLDNRQQSIINKANVLAQFEVANLDARQAALVNNAKAFLQMDLTNMNNRQQAEVINTQSMVQALFTDQAAINAQRLFTAETNNDFEKFYDQLSVNVGQFNATQMNSMSQFNAGAKNTAMQFNSEMENQRQQFYANMQYNIDVANAKWRQTVETENNRLTFEAASTDVKNMLNISQEGMNQIWDRLDSIFDNIWKSAENELSREAQIIAAEIAAMSKGSGGKDGMWSAIGQIGAAIIMSDERLKTDIKHFSTLPSGVRMYTWKWNKEAQRLGAPAKSSMGVIAQEIQKTHPDAVVTGDHGYLMVNYGKIQ
jgi:hypothetical protein